MAEDPLLKTMDEYVADLLEEAKNNKTGEEGIEFGDRVRLLSSATAFLATKYKIDPPKEEESGISQMQKAFTKGRSK